MNDDRDIALFSYGTLQLAEVQRATFGRSLHGESDALSGYRRSSIRIEDAQVVATSGEAYHPIVEYSGDPADTVPGTVFAISAKELAQADAYEVDDYERVEAPLLSGRRAWVYVKRKTQS
ncbi:UDP-N-acetylmuramate--alanine ligase [Lysobacter sp. Root667]|uniref:gamma-glutamylcyclotransferase family protein n=1 Tax=Lysobacter sp. Root667 TaxID=1736581 RepID=UPI0006FABDF2|nr:gamma-glutamylcyclotransferase family protein [Lysobacter sp. Root667]KRA75346.1 UDP-N-acetylmuramate--alanine ligase [Lysobacter sp. Root667]